MDADEGQPDLVLVEAVRRALAEVADPDKAEPMRAYMKSAMPMLGVQKPARTAVLGPLLAAHPLPEPGVWRATVLAIWRDATYREERYAALAVARQRSAWSYLTGDVPAAVDLLDELIVTGAWWDLVDETATSLVGPLLRARREQVTPVVWTWATDADRWRRRTAVICQIGAKTETDVDLLAAAVEANAADPDFFLRKGIGWALREYAKTDPDWVRRFVGTHELETLSRREALKHLA